MGPWGLFGVLTILLFTSSFLAGLVPGCLPRWGAGSRALRLVDSFGSALVLGTGLGVVVPEGVSLFIAASSAAHPAVGIGFCLCLGFATMHVLELVLPSSGAPCVSHRFFNHHWNLARRWAGLGVHCVFDGVALGVAAAVPANAGHLPGHSSPSSTQEPTSHTDAPTAVTWVVFAALIIHKFPMAFGLAVHLLGLRVSVRDGA